MSSSNKMQIFLNGQEQSTQSGITVKDLLSDLELEPIRVAVEINEDIVPRKAFNEKIIQNGDRIEIVTFVGGG